LAVSVEKLKENTKSRVGRMVRSGRKMGQLKKRVS